MGFLKKKSKEKFPCPACGHEFKSIKKLRKHVRDILRCGARAKWDL